MCIRDSAKTKPAVLALAKAVEEGRPTEWARVHRLPDHVFFTHERHVVAGLACRECHGRVDEMQLVRQVAPLTMGFCIECHARRGAPLDCLACHK